MATPNYSYEKRQRELAKKRKKEEKAQRKASGKGPDEPGTEPTPGDAALGTPPAGGSAPGGSGSGS